MMKYGLGTEIVMEGKWFPEDVTMERDWSELACSSVGEAVQGIIPIFICAVVLKGFGVERGFWTSPVLPPEKKS